MISPNTQITYR